LFTWEDVLPHFSVVEEQKCTMCFFGHTHSPGIFSKDGVYTVDSDSKFELGDSKSFFINVGSVGQPRDGDPRAAFGLIDLETREYEQIRSRPPASHPSSQSVCSSVANPAVKAINPDAGWCLQTCCFFTNFREKQHGPVLAFER
jgi:hypothetical protein